MNKTILFIPLLVSIVSFSACDHAEGSEGTDDTDDTGGTDTTTSDTDNNDNHISNVDVRVHHRVKTILVVSWTQNISVDEVWLKYTFENDEWHTSPPRSGDLGAQEEVVLGVPEQTVVTIHIVNKQGETASQSSAHTGTTGRIPLNMPEPTVETYDEDLASDNQYLFGSVDDTDHIKDYYGGPFWLYIIDRRGRIVWYYSDLGDNPIIGFPRISRNNRYIYFGNRTPWDQYGHYEPWVVRMTLDWEWFEETDMNLWDNLDMTSDGSYLFNTLPEWGKESWLTEITAKGVEKPIWNVSAELGKSSPYSNTINWNPLDDTILMSFPHSDTAFEIDRQNGGVIAMYGDTPGCYRFSPPSWEFEFQHFVNVTRFGTLMVSTHMPNSTTEHAFVEFDIDRKNEVLTEKWVYNSGGEWAEYMGEAHYVDGSDNILANYGTGGVIKEITKGKQVAWQVKWDAPFHDDDYNKMVGHCTLLNDLYDINRGNL